MDKTISCRKVGGFCRLFFAKERMKALKGKPDGNLYARLVLPEIFLLKACTITQLFDSDTEQSTDDLFFLREPVFLSEAISDL